VRIIVAGFGRIGRRLVKLLLDHGYTVVAIADSKGYALSHTGLSRSCIDELLSAPRGGIRGTSCGQGGSLINVLDGLDYDALVLVTASRYEDGEPGLSYALRVVKRGKILVSADKPPLAHKLAYLLDLARETRSRLYYKATVMAGTPLLDLLSYGLRGRRIRRITAAVNTTTNYVLSLVESGVSLEDAVSKAVEQGIAEPNPRSDLEGMDLAAKAAIIAQTVGCRLTLREVEVEATAYDAKPGERLVAVIDTTKCRAQVTLHRVRGPEDPLAHARGLRCVAVIETQDTNQPIVVAGPGAGIEVTSYTLLSDLELARLHTYST
jgi:homoserine dehydrogenase